ncbi:MAG: hypothetical protein ACXVH2_04145 [Methanobacterium sp.]
MIPSEIGFLNPLFIHIAINIGFLNYILIYLAIVIGIANIGLLIGLFYFYRESYKEIKSKFTFGLLYFTSILLIGNLISIIALSYSLVSGIEIHEFSGTVIYSILLLINAAELIAFAILFKMTWE